MVIMNSTTFIDCRGIYLSWRSRC